jgi:hypothetical protein
MEIQNISTKSLVKNGDPAWLYFDGFSLPPSEFRYAYLTGKAGDNEEKLRYEMIDAQGFQVNNLLSEEGQRILIEKAMPLFTEFCLKFHELDKVKEKISEFCLSESCKNEYHVMPKDTVSADALLGTMSLHDAWPENFEIGQASTALVLRMAAEGKKIVGDLQRAFFHRLEETEAAGESLTPEQLDFLEEERRINQYNPLFQKPTPFGGV